MSTIVTGIVLIALGFLNIYGSRKRPDLPNAGFLARVGWVGMGCGVVVVVYGVVGLIRTPG